MKRKLNKFSVEDKTILEDVIDCLYYKDNLKVGQVTVTHRAIANMKLCTKFDSTQYWRF